MSFFSKPDPFEKLKAQLEQKPKDTKLLLEMAGLLKEKGLTGAAVEHYLRAGQTLVEQGFAHKAASIAKQAIQAAPKAAEPYEFLARCYEELKLKEDLRGVLKTLVGVHASAGNVAEATSLRKKIEALGPGR
jgi:thioredoxin-like negative regulator of GroEL